MKTILLTISAMLLISCAPNPEKMIKKSIQNYLNENLNDPASYEPIEFGDIDTLEIVWEDSKVYRNYFFMKDLNERTIIDAKNQIAEYGKDIPEIIEKKQKEIENAQKKIDSLTVVYNKEKENFQEGQYYLIVNHSYRSKNGFGSLMRHKYQFTINPNDYSIVDVNEISE